jgi:hypothetical protein
MMALPTELWIIIFDLVIQEGIIRVDQCDHTKFPYIQSTLSSLRFRYHFYDSYHRLRLVCRSFKSILGDPPSQILSPSSIFPLSTTTRAVILDLDAWPKTDFQPFSAETLSYGRLVYLDVTCSLDPSSDRPTLSDFLSASAGRALHNVQRLTLRIVNNVRIGLERNFWARLHGAFPWLVTLVITHENHIGGYLALSGIAGPATFERLEILYLARDIGFVKCRFPRLRHAFKWSCSHTELEMLTGSAHLNSLLLHSYDPTPPTPIDVNLCPQLKLLGIQQLNPVVSLKGEHPLEHLWIYLDDQLDNSWSLPKFQHWLPWVPRVTIELSPTIDEKRRAWIAQELQGMGFASMGTGMGSAVGGDGLWFIERSPLSVGV